MIAAVDWPALMLVRIFMMNFSSVMWISRGLLRMPDRL
jgi:hypothetical protein